MASRSVHANDASAQPACEAGKHIAVAFDASLAPTLQAETLADLQAELSTRNLTVCLSATSIAGTAVADVKIEARGPGRIALDVYDRSTDKRVGRDLSLAGIRDNGQALAIAIAVDELLRASWAELTLRAPPSPAPVVVASKPALAPTRAPLALGLGLEGTYVRGFDRYDAFGGAAVLDTLSWGTLWLDARLGFSRALERRVAEGVIDVQGPNGALTIGACRKRKGRVSRLCGGARTASELLTFRGESDSSSAGRSTRQMLVSAAAVGQMRLTLVRTLSLAITVGAGTTLLGARISNGTRTLASIDGLLLQTGVGLAVDL